MEKKANGGKAAWDHLMARYSRKDAGTTTTLLHQYLRLQWDGGDHESFAAFLNRKSSLRSDLTQRSYVISDDAYAAHLIGSVL